MSPQYLFIKRMIDMIYETTGTEMTQTLGISMGKKAKAGEVYCLRGDLGVGKTAFSKGFAKGLGITETVTSPTFTIINEYDEGRLPLYHFDVYRISSLEEMDDTGCEEYFYGQGVCLVEWAEMVAELIPSDACWITIEKDLEKGTEYRKISVEQKGVGE